ncbi:hypothetical protein EWM64_g1775 [Hericium alpestre]|uniref:Uncharacterized protein n=1 Tax=Hericium alpestre TaxID=135208 RepID=A0A4Z0A9J8_9AGAM|nr:hypothetical protein EWM64_g1775 [Hericium alpestre]
MEATVKHLDCISGVNLYLEPVSHPDYGFIVARYSKYSWYHEELAERPEQMVIDLIRKELNVDDTPQWHHYVSP